MYLPGRSHSYLNKLEVAHAYQSAASSSPFGRPDLKAVAEQCQVWSGISYFDSYGWTGATLASWEASRQNPMIFLGHELFLKHSNLVIKQEHYCQSILDRFSHLTENKPLQNLKKEDFASEFLGKSDFLDKEKHTEFRGIIGALMFLVLCSRPDLAAAVNTLAEGQSSPTHNCS